MTDAKKEVQEAIAMLSVLSASGDALDLIAAVKSKLKKAISGLEGKEENG